MQDIDAWARADGVLAGRTLKQQKSGQESVVAGNDSGEGTIELTLPAVPTHLAAARSLAAELAARMDFNLDEVDDLRMAVEEACATLVSRAVPVSRLSCVFELSPDEIVVEVCANSKTDDPPAQDTFGWQVLTTLVDEVQVLPDPERGPNGDSRYRIGIKLRKRRMESTK